MASLHNPAKHIKWSLRASIQYLRTRTLLIHLNHDIHNFSDVIVPLFEEVHWRQIFFVKFCFRDNFEGKNPMGIKCLS